MQEVDAGRLDLHVSVNEILPWLELPEPFGPITMHHLLTHTAGLHTGTEDAPGFAGALHLLRTHPATCAPGERFHYSNDGYKIVGAVLEDLTGLPIHELLRDRLLGPARDDVVGGRDHRRDLDRPRHRLRADADRPARAAPTSARPGPADHLEHRRRLDRLDRRGHVRVRAAPAWRAGTSPTAAADGSCRRRGSRG